MDENKFNDDQRYYLKKTIDRCNSHKSDRINTVDELRIAIEQMDTYMEAKITEQDFWEYSGWTYCTWCREITDSCYYDIHNEDPEKLREDHYSEEEIEAVQEMKDKYPNCNCVCWDCVYQYIGRKKLAREMFGELSMSSVDEESLKLCKRSCAQKLLGLKAMISDIDKELLRREEKKKRD